MQDVEANDYAARHGCPVQSLRSFPGCPAAWLFPANPACPCPCPDSPSCPCAARVCLLLPGCLRCCSSEALDCLEGHCEGGRHQTRHSCPSREGERGERREGSAGSSRRYHGAEQLGGRQNVSDLDPTLTEFGSHLPLHARETCIQHNLGVRELWFACSNLGKHRKAAWTA